MGWYTLSTETKLTDLGRFWSAYTNSSFYWQGQERRRREQESAEDMSSVAERWDNKWASGEVKRGSIKDGERRPCHMIEADEHWQYTVFSKKPSITISSLCSGILFFTAAENKIDIFFKENLNRKRFCSFWFFWFHPPTQKNIWFEPDQNSGVLSGLLLFRQAIIWGVCCQAGGSLGVLSAVGSFSNKANIK